MTVAELIFALQKYNPAARVSLVGSLQMANGDLDDVLDFDVTNIHDDWYDTDECDHVSLEFVRETE
jgi:hypothetical protein